jgi:uncharacterized membrane protein
MPTRTLRPMTTESTATGESGRVDWRRAEFILTLLGFLGFITVGIKITTVYDGLPAHPLIIHVPVVLIPLSILGSLACVWRPAWFGRYGILLCSMAIVAMSSIFLAMQAGSALRGLLNLQGRAAQLISQHSQAANILAILFIAFTAILILTFSATRISGEMGPTGLTIADQTLGSRSTLTALRVLLVVLALACAFWVFRVGDLGAKAVWQGRVQAAQLHHGPSGY